MSTDIFAFWEGVPGDARTHPDDKAVLDRAEHGFDTRCLPASYAGPLRTARVVLLYLSPGLAQRDIDEADDAAAHARYLRRREGYAPLDGPDDHREGWQWWSARTRRFGNWHDLRDKVAFLNISPYHSATFKDYHMLAALPSCRASLSWAQSVLFPQANDGERVVVCLRSAQWWGLGKRGRYGRSLFAPAVGRGGHMLADGTETAKRDDVVEAVKAVLEREPLSE